ncbi:unnamed protein product [Linum tenue]|nr:unnamed protein product [Linum tenue]
MGLQLGQLSYIVVSSPEAAREVLQAHDLTFASRQYLLASEIVFYGAKNVALAPYGAYWRQIRKICVVELLSARRVSSFRHIRESEVSKLTAAVSSAAVGVVDLGKLVMAASSGFTFRAAFGMAAKKESLFSGLIAEMSKSVGTFRVSDLFPSIGFLPALTGFRSHLTKLHLGVDGLLQEIIDEHRARRSNRGRSDAAAVEDSEDLVDILLNLQEDGSHDLGIPLTNDTIKAIIMDMFSGGIETTSITVEWTISELMRNPSVMERAQEEVRNMFGGEGNVNEEGLSNLTYLDLVIQETLRLHPALPLLLPREARERAEIHGYEIPSQTKVIINAWAIGRDPRYWTEPDKFLPERYFVRPTNFKGKDFEFIPFGSGRRMCPGMSFGLVMVKLALANLLYHFDWYLPTGTTPENLDMTECFAASVRRKHSLCLIPVAHDALQK